MPIFDQGYQHWQGQLAGPAWRWWAVTRRGVRTQFKSRWVQWLVVVSLAPAFALVGILALWGLVEQRVGFVTWIINALESAHFSDVAKTPQQYRMTVWTLAFHFFFLIQFFFAMLLVLLVGPDLISKDLRFNALPLYLSRPLRRADYFLGKLGIIGVYLAAVTVVPAVLAYVLGVMFSLDFQVARQALPLLGASLVISAVVIASAGTLMLALSSLSRNSRYVGMMWMGLWLVSGMAAGTLFGILRTEEWPLVLSYTRNFQRLSESMLGTDEAFDTVERLFNTARRTAQQAQQVAELQAMMGGGRGGPPGRSRRPVAIPPPAAAGADPPSPRSNPFRSRYPWTWSAGVLAGLWGLSVWVLTLRVRSLDRLK